MAHEFTHPTIGQEAVCPDGVGRVIAFLDDFPHQWIQVSTYANDRQCKWAPHNVKLIDPLQVRPEQMSSENKATVTLLAEHPAVMSLRAIQAHPNCRQEVEAQLGQEIFFPLSMDNEYGDMMKLASEIRDLIFEDGDGTMQGAMIGSPVECLAFAKWWIQRAKGAKPDQDWFAKTEVVNQKALAVDKMADALRTIAGQDPVEMALDSQWAARVARITLTECGYEA